MLQPYTLMQTLMEPIRFTYKANDGTLDSNIATVTMTVSAEDDEPNTLDVATTTDEDVAVTVNLSAEEYDGDSYSFAIVTDVSNGTTSLNGSTVTYTPNQDFNGEIPSLLRLQMILEER